MTSRQTRASNPLNPRAPGVSEWQELESIIREAGARRPEEEKKEQPEQKREDMSDSKIVEPAPEAAPVAPMGGPSIAVYPPNRWNGVGNIELWIKKYEAFFISMRYEERSKALIFLNFLSDNAEKFYNTLPTATQDDYTLLKQAFILRYKKPLPDKAEALRAIGRRDMKPNETVAQYFEEMNKMGTDCKGLSQNALAQLIYGGLPLEYRRRMNLVEIPETMSIPELQQKAEREELFEKLNSASSSKALAAIANDSTHYSWGARNAITRPPSTDRYVPPQNRHRGNMNSNTRRENPSPAVATHFTSTPLYPKGNSDLSHIVCFNCKKAGHYATECPYPKNAYSYVPRGDYTNPSSSSSSVPMVKREAVPAININSTPTRAEQLVRGNQNTNPGSNYGRQPGHGNGTYGNVRYVENNMDEYAYHQNTNTDHELEPEIGHDIHSHDANVRCAETEEIVRAIQPSSGPIMGTLTPSYYVSLSLEGGQPTTAFIDCGAGMTICPKELYEKFPQPVRNRPLMGSTMLIKDISGSPLKVEGIGVYSASFLSRKGESLTHLSLPVYVVANLPLNTPLILGNDFIDSCVENIKVTDRVIVLKNGTSIPLTVIAKGTNSLEVKAIGKHVVPPRAEVMIDAQICSIGSNNDQTTARNVDDGDSKSDGQDDTDSRRIGTYFEAKTNDILSAVTGLVQVGENQTTQIRLVNNSMSSCFVEDGDPLGTIEPVHDITPRDTEWASIGQVTAAEDELDDPPFSLSHADTVDPPSKTLDMETLFEEINLEDESNSLTIEEKKKLKEFLWQNCDVFAKNPKAPETTYMVSHRIDTGNHAPIFEKLRRVSPAEQQLQEEQRIQMQENGIVVPSKGPWSSNLVLVQKSDKTVRVCVDYRRLNAITKADKYPLPRIDDTLNSLGKAVYYTTLDLASGYWQIPMHPEDREKTAFSTRHGHWEFVVMPFGLINAPATFQRTMDILLAGLTYIFVLVYLDDIIIFSPTFESHLQHLSAVFARLREGGFSLKASKCHFACKKVKYLGFVVSAEGIRADPAKIEVLKVYPPPRDLKGVRSFLGFAGYYRILIETLAHDAAPLYKLSSKDTAFKWTEVEQRAFDKIRNKLISDPIVALPDFTKPFIIYADASLSGLGAVLSQKIDGVERVIAYASKTLNPAQRRYATTERECLAVKYACQHFRSYIWGTRFTIVTDHAALKWLINHKDSSSRLMRWALFLQEYDFEIIHRSGASHANADALSRLPGLLESEGTQDVNNVSLREKETRENEARIQTHDRGKSKQWNRGIRVATVLNDQTSVLSWTKIDLAAEQRKDKQLLNIFDMLEGRTEIPGPAKEEMKLYHIVDGILLKCWHQKPRESVDDMRPVIPQQLRVQVIESFHDEPLGGHLGRMKTFEKIRSRVYWNNMETDINLWVRTCAKCNAKKRSYTNGQRIQGVFDIPSCPWERVSIDILGPLPVSRSENQYILTVTDHFTCWVEAFALPSTKTEIIAQVFIDEIVCRYGAPKLLLSDQGKNFVGGLAQEIWKMLNIKKIQTTPYHPQTNGRTERFNHTLTTMLSMYVNENQKDWDQFLNYVMFAYRTSIHSLLNESPYYLLFGRNPITPFDAMISGPEVSEFTKTEKDWHKIYLNDMQRHLQVAHDVARKAHQEKMDRTNEENRKIEPEKLITFDIGDIVLICEPHIKRGLTRKLNKPWKGPYMVTNVYGNKLNYQVQKLKSDGKPSTNSKLKVVNVKFMKLYKAPLSSPLRSEKEIITLEKNDDDQKDEAAHDIDQELLPNSEPLSEPVYVQQQLDLERPAPNKKSDVVPNTSYVNGHRKSNRVGQGLRNFG
ncbi:MAG TPA: reverse transcriptase domain-containing protein, partial [Candidatus Saccharimonadales bacterium]